ncbi:MAG: site-specific integrase [Clostridia bacterium]|nr:site-specific integrase [Clostridia bacterium]
MARKRANGEGSIRKRSNSCWEARITIGVNPETRKLISKSVYGKTQREVREKMKALEEKKEPKGSVYVALSSDAPTDAEQSAGPKEMTVGEWLDTWLKEYLADVKQGTIIHYESVVRLFLKPEFGDVPLSQLRTPMVQKLYNRLREEKRSPKYIKNIHGILHRALEMAVRLEYMMRNPTTACVIPRVVEKKVTPLDAPDQKKLFEVLRGEEFEALFMTDIFTGLRSGELIGLTWDCVDFDHGIIRVEKQLCQVRQKGLQFYFGTLKNGKTRIIEPAPFVMEILKKHRAEQERRKKNAGDFWNEGEFPNLVFTHADGSHLNQWFVCRTFQSYLVKAGLPHHRMHDLRHTFAVNSIMAGDDIKTIQENMGHYSAAFTLDRYGHVTDTMRHQSSNRMQAFIRDLTS